MKEIKLTRDFVALVDDSDFEWLNQFKWYVHKCSNKFYATTGVGGRKNHKKIRMHRLIMGVTDSKILVDHENGNTMDYQRTNLRIATSSQNNANRVSRANSSSKYKGVSWDKKYKKWHSRVRKSGVVKHVGYYDNEAEAALAYNNAAIQLHGEFANLNKVA